MMASFDNNFKSKYTKCALTERIKQDLTKIPLDKEQYLQKIREHKKKEVQNQEYFDYELEIDLSIDLGEPRSISRKLYDDRWYYYKAHHYLKIGVFRNAPSFKVSLSHLSTNVIHELNTFDLVTRNYILKQAVTKIFEDINFDLYHNSISSRLEVVLVN